MMTIQPHTDNAQPHTIVKIDPSTPRSEFDAELTDQQRKQIKFAEDRYREAGILDEPESQTALLSFTLDFVNGNRIDADHAHIEVPAGAKIDGAGWERDLGGDIITYSRALTWREFGTGVDSVGLDISGRQSTSGDFTRQIQLYAEGDRLNAADARRLAATLVEAADELDRLS